MTHPIYVISGRNYRCRVPQVPILGPGIDEPHPAVYRKCLGTGHGFTGFAKTPLGR